MSSILKFWIVAAYIHSEAIISNFLELGDISTVYEDYSEMTSNTNSFEQFGLIVKVPTDTKVDVVDGRYSYYPKSASSSPASSSPANYRPSKLLSGIPNSVNVEVVDRRNPSHIRNIEDYLQTSQPSGSAWNGHRGKFEDANIEDSKKQYSYHLNARDAPISKRNLSVTPTLYPHHKAVSKDYDATASNIFVMPMPLHEIAPIEKATVLHSFEEMVTDQPSQNKRTLVVLDCANIGWAYGESQFLADGIRLALDFFKHYEVDVIAFIPSSYVKKKPRDGSSGNSMMDTEDRQQLETLIRVGDVTVVPAGDHDDVYILSYARSNNGFIVSNDFFIDHIATIDELSIKRSMKLWLNVNRCGFTFLKNSIFMINPGNVLSTVLGYMAFQERRLDFDSKCSTVIDSVTSSIQVLFHNECYQQLKYVLLARAVSYMEVSLFCLKLLKLYSMKRNLFSIKMFYDYIFIVIFTILTVPIHNIIIDLLSIFVILHSFSVF